MTSYPEHEKMKAVKDKSQTIGEFLDWLKDTKKVFLAHYLMVCEHQDFDGGCKEDLQEDGVCPKECPDRYMIELGELYEYSYNVQELLASFFEIDLKKIDKEKRAMLDEMRKLNESAG